MPEPTMFDDLAIRTSNNPGAYQEPEVSEVYVSQDTENAGHKVKFASEIKRGRATFYVWECICGESSALHLSKGEANESYLAHKNAG